MYDYALLDALCAVARTGSFEGAAAQLNVTPSAISQRIKSLEDRVGTILIKRGQPCRATDAGARLITHTDQVRLMEKALNDDLMPVGSGALTPLRTAVNADSLATWFLPTLASQLGFLYDLVIDDQDHSTDWLRNGTVSAAITGSAKPVQGCDCYPLGALRYIATASPAFMDRWMPNGPTADALKSAPALTFNPKDTLQLRWAHKLTGERLTLPTHHIATSNGFVQAACLGMGWGMNPEALVAELLDHGDLLALVPGLPLDTPLYWQVNRVAKTSLRDLTSAVRDIAGQALIQA